MTAPRNFPGRVNERRKLALARIDEQLTSGVGRFNGHEYPLEAKDRERLNREADALALRIKPVEVARAVRTKKDRSGTGRLSR